MSTNSLSAKDIKRAWHLIDAKDQTLGRLSTQIATLIIGKHKSNYVPYLDNGDSVVVINASKVRVSGKKSLQKTYFRHSGFPGGDKVESFARLIVRRPEKIIEHAVWGMVPKTKLGKKMINKLYVFPGEKHDFEKQLGIKKTEESSDAKAMEDKKVAEAGAAPTV